MPDMDALKRNAALAALAHVHSGMRLGLGTGSTAAFLVRELGQALAAGRLRDIAGVPTSEATATLARAVGVPLMDLPSDGVDLAIDGMDEVDANMDAIKGLGGALTREKVVASSARAFILMADAGKRVAQLGVNTPIPVEVLRFGLERTSARIAALDCRPVLRLAGGNPFVTDSGQAIVDAHLTRPLSASELRALAAALDAIPGVVAHGLFLGMATRVILAGANGVEEQVEGA
jgi:ribose 5-phosphate isomerase A